MPGHFTFYSETIVDNFAVFSESESKHISQVLRYQVGDEIEFTDGKGKMFYGNIDSIENRVVKVRVENKVEFSVPKTTIAVGILKNSDRMEWLVEKATELGVHSIFWMTTDNTERSKLNIDKHKKTAISAMKQSHSTWLPIIQMVSFKSIIESNSYNTKLISHCQGELDELKSGNFSGNTLVLIGPEGDFSSQEVTIAVNLGFNPIGLGTRILRTETAVLKVLSLQ